MRALNVYLILGFYRILRAKYGLSRKVKKTFLRMSGHFGNVFLHYFFYVRAKIIFGYANILCKPKEYCRLHLSDG